MRCGQRSKNNVKRSPPFEREYPLASSMYGSLPKRIVS